MTHEELLAKMDDFNVALSNGFGDVKVIIGSVNAVRAVVELHKPEPFGLDPSGFICAGCDNRCGCYEGDILSHNDWFTCPTIKAIEKELQ